MPNITPAKIRRILRDAGFSPVANHPKQRGLKVIPGVVVEQVTLYADLGGARSDSEEMVTTIKAILENAGYAVRIFGGDATLATITVREVSAAAGR